MVNDYYRNDYYVVAVPHFYIHNQNCLWDGYESSTFGYYETS